MANLKFECKKEKKKIHNCFIISKNDFEAAIEYLRELDSVNESSYAYEALWMMVIISYFRPFTCNEKEKNSRAAPNIEAPKMTNEEKALHEKLKFCRMKIVAHSEIKTNPTSTDYSIGITWSKRANIWEILQEYQFSKEEVLALAQKMREHCLNRAADLMNEAKNKIMPITYRKSV